MDNKKIKVDSEHMNKISEVHILPCKIYYNGDASVKSFFTNSIIKSQNNSNSKEENFNTEGTIG